jgi:hypothetical protein
VAIAAALTCLTALVLLLSRFLGPFVLVPFGIFVAVMFALAFRSRAGEFAQWGRELEERGPDDER